MELNSLKSALEGWKEILGKKGVITDKRQIELYQKNCESISRQISAILLPCNTTGVAKIVKVARQFKVPLYPISTGRNWGYGSSNPIRNNCVLVDLSLMRNIEMDFENGLVTLEPGVTQKMLENFLGKTEHEDKPKYLIPVTGAGPNCSLLGNALERGYGITPYTDHFSAVTWLEAVLPDGNIHYSMMSNLGGHEIDRSFKYGVGPYLDGLFSQSNFGIVTRITIALAPIPEKIEAFFFSIEDKDSLAPLISAIRKIIREMGGMIGSINLMNKHRVLSMAEPYPHEHIGPDNLITETAVNELAKRNQIGAWTGVGAIYGNKKVVAAVRSEIRKTLRPITQRLIFLTPKTTDLVLHSLRKIPLIKNLSVINTLKTINKSMQLIQGKPSTVALPLAYWKSGKKPEDEQEMNPAQNGCGLIWFSPLVPMNSTKINEYIILVTNICKKHGIEPLVTLTTFSDRCLDSTIPILFDRQNRVEAEKAHSCYQELLETGQKHGFVPYRLGIQSMEFLTKTNAVPSVLKTLKAAIDPDNIIAPGRYGN